MVHKNTELLTNYWRARIPPVGCPPRSSIDPTQFLDLLPQVFILGRPGAGHFGFRLVGGLLADLHGPGLQGADFLGLWMSPDRASLKSAMEGAARRGHPLIVHCKGRSLAGHTVEIEMLLAPLTGNTGQVDRFLGLYQPTSSLSRLMGAQVDQLADQRIGLTGDSGMEAALVEAPRLRLAAMDGRLIA